MRTVFKLLGCLTLVMCLVLGFSTSALAYNEVYVVHESGILAPGQQAQGGFTYTAGRTVGVIVARALINAPDNVSQQMTVTVTPMFNFKYLTATNQTNSELLFSGTVANNQAGKAQVWYVGNESSTYSMAYSIAVIERWD